MIPRTRTSRWLSQCLPLTAALCLAAAGACGDDDDDQPSDAGVDAGSAGKGGSEGGGGKGGSAGMDAGGGKGGSGGKGGMPAPPEPDAGMEEPDAGPPPQAFRDLSIQMTGMTDEVGEFMQFRLIDSNDNLLLMSVIHGLPSASYTFELPNSVPAGEEVVLQIWADTAGTVDNAYDMAMDHAWEVTIPSGAATQDVLIPLAHGAQTPPPTVGDGTATGSLGFTMSDTGSYSGDAFELRVFEQPSGRLVGRQLLDVPGSQISLEVYGVIANGSNYRVDFAIDANDDGNYDAPPADAAWRRTATGSATGYNSGPGATITLANPPPSGEYVDVGF